MRRFLIYLFWGALVAYPSPQILQTTALNIEMPWPTQLRPGQLLQFRQASPIQFAINGKIFTPHPSGDKVFAVVPLARVVELNAWEPPRKKGLFSHPIWPIHRVSVPVDLAPGQVAASLRLPAAVQKRLNSAEETRRKADRELLNQILSASSFPLELSCWGLPLRSKKTSEFSSPRTLPSGRTYHHTGEDRRAQVGAPVRSVASGRVVFAGEMVVPGKSVIIDHGQFIHSRYLHLSDFKVRPGQIVSAGEVIGLSGATGRVEAPHLHWEILWHKNHAHPSEFVSEWNKSCEKPKGASAT